MLKFFKYCYDGSLLNIVCYYVMYCNCLYLKYLGEFKLEN